jgi:hypothetical protein
MNWTELTTKLTRKEDRTCFILMLSSLTTRGGGKARTAYKILVAKGQRNSLIRRYRKCNLKYTEQGSKNKKLTTPSREGPLKGLRYVVCCNEGH